MGLMATLGHFFLILAYGRAPAATLTPYMYTQIVWMIAVGYLFFGDVPDRWTVAGAALILAVIGVLFAGVIKTWRYVRRSEREFSSNQSNIKFITMIR